MGDSAKGLMVAEPDEGQGRLRLSIATTAKTDEKKKKKNVAGDEYGREMDKRR